MQDHAPADARQFVFGEPYAFEHRLRRQIGRVGASIASIHIGIVDQPRQRHAYGAVALGRRRPLNLLDRATRAGDGVGEGRQADIDDLKVVG